MLSLISLEKDEFPHALQIGQMAGEKFLVFGKDVILKMTALC